MEWMIWISIGLIPVFIVNNLILWWNLLKVKNDWKRKQVKGELNIGSGMTIYLVDEEISIFDLEETYLLGRISIIQEIGNDRNFFMITGPEGLNIRRKKKTTVIKTLGIFKGVNDEFSEILEQIFKCLALSILPLNFNSYLIVFQKNIAVIQENPYEEKIITKEKLQETIGNIILSSNVLKLILGKNEKNGKWKELKDFIRNLNGIETSYSTE